MSQPAFKLERVLYRRKQSEYCGFRKLGIALDTKRIHLHHALVHEEGIACVDVETGQTIRTIAMTGTSGAKDCSYSAPENLCCCAAGRSLVCFDSRQPTVALQLNEIESAISAISCSNDGRYIAYASSDSTVGLFSLRMGCVVRPGLFHTSSVNSCWFDEDNSGFWTAGSDRMVSKFKAETGTSQANYKDHADPINVCKPSLDGSMIASGAADHAVALRQILRGRLKSSKDKVVLLGHSTPVTEVLFTNNNTGLCSFSQDGHILLWDVGRVSVHGQDLQGLFKRNQMYGDDRADFDKSMFELQEHCKQFVSAKTSMLELCNWTENPFLQTTVPCSSQRCPGDLSVSRSRKLVGDTGIGKAIATPHTTSAGNLMICSCKQGVILIRVNTECISS